MNVSPKLMTVLLAGSVALNLFCLGAWAGRRFGEPRGPGRREPYGVGAFMHRSGLEDSNPVVKRVMNAHRSLIRERMHAIGLARNEIRNAVSTEPFDPARLETKITNLKSATAALQDEMLSALLELSRTLDPEQRKRLADAVWPHSRFGHGPRSF